ncbi:PH domain-containing protein [Rhodococcus sp. NPDC058505]|uniref:PH domain-containing protein n=1 Tax=unclassified Rhodococcus (in: high G+C Gram-positive bacteria) TaxID=192944 RepID=UPI003666D15E
MNGPATGWSTPAAALAATGVGGVAMAIAALAVPADPAGRVLIGLAALGLLTITALGARQRPRLAIQDGDRGLTMQRLLGRLDVDRTEVSRIRVVRYPRLGRRVPMLEIDIRPPGVDDDRLLIFGRWDLGTDPATVFEELDARGLVPPDRRSATP